MSISPLHPADSPFALPAGEIDILTGTLSPVASLTPAAPRSTGGKATRKRGGKTSAAKWAAPLVGRDRELVRWLTRVRYASHPQIRARWFPLDQMPTVSASGKWLTRLSSRGWIESRPGIGGYPLWQATSRGYNEVGEGLRHLDASLGTLQHGLLLVDLIVDLETGRQELPRGYPTGEGLTVVTERVITHEDKAPGKMRKQPRSPGVTVTPGGGVVEADQPVDEYHPKYGYLSSDGQRRGFPDALIVPVPSDQWEPGQSVTDAIAVEVELSEKSVHEYRALLAAYADTTWRTAPQEARDAIFASQQGLSLVDLQGRPRQMAAGGQFRHVLYVCGSERIRSLVVRATQELGLTGFVLTMLAPPPRYDRNPPRTTPEWPAEKRPRREVPVRSRLMRLPKQEIVEHLVAMGLGEAVVEALTRTA